MNIYNSNSRKFIQLTVKIKQFKRFHSNQAILDGIVICGSPNRIEVGETCFVNIRSPPLDVLSLCGYLLNVDGSSNSNDAGGGGGRGGSNGGATRWIKISDEINQVIIVFHVDPMVTIERNRKGVKVLDCYNVVEILSNKRDNNNNNNSSNNNNNNNNNNKNNAENLSAHDGSNNIKNEDNIQKDYLVDSENDRDHEDDESKANNNIVTKELMNGWNSSGILSSSEVIATTAPCLIYDKSERHRLFARWLIETYGYENLCAGSGILDVAGGNGELSIALTRMGIPSTILDPNPRIDINKLYANDDEENNKSNNKNNFTSQNNTDPLSLLKIIPKAIYDDGSHLTDVDVHKSNDKINDNKELEYNDNTSPAINIKDLIHNCSIIVGMHPDQATEAIVDMAIRLKKRFAILPCCVMPSLFPDRVQKIHGTPVRSYSSFCQYLLDKAPSVDKNFEDTHLPFIGRNQIIYCFDLS